MKFTVIGPVYPYRGGISHFTTLLAFALKERHDTLVFSFRRQYPSPLYPGQSDKDNSKEPLKIFAEYTLDPLFPWTWISTSSRIVQSHPDLLIVQWWTTFWAFGFASVCYLVRRHSFKTLFIIHNILPHEVKFYDRWLGKIALKQADFLIVQSERELINLRKLLPHANAILFPMPAFDVFTQQRIDKKQARKQLNLPPDVPVALFFGIVRPYKGLVYLIRAIAHLKNRGEILHLIIAGEFWENENLYRKHILDLDLTEQVHIDNRYIPNEEIGIIFSAADVFVAPYTMSTQSAAIRIAIGFGLPSIVSTTVAEPGLEAVSNIHFVPPFDSEAIADQLSIISSAISAGKIPKTITNVFPGWEELVNEIEQIAISANKPKV